MKRSTFTFPFLAAALALGLIVASTSAAAAAQRPLGELDAVGAPATSVSSPAALKLRWDIVSYNFAVTPVTVSTGGKASAKASDRSTITLTGSGTFGGAATNVTGGGNWTTLNPAGRTTGSGTYTVKELVGFFAAPGTFGDPTGTYQLADQIGNSTSAHAGLAILRIAYSDGSQGTLIISSRQAGTPSSVFTGITATKDYVGYWLLQAAKAGVDGNRTLFHVVG
jgi:hypothetical protein